MITGFAMKELVSDEIIERRQEGYAVPDYPIDAMDDDELEKLYDSFDLLKIRDDFKYVEPDGLENILAESTGCTYRKKPDDSSIFSRFYGAWLGRIVGCIMGKPLEISPYGIGNGELDGWECIKLWQEGAGDTFPPVNYISGTSKARTDNGFDVCCELSQRENIKYAESDDDIRYLVLALMTNEKYGNDFTADNIADMWQRNLSPMMTFTAERVALINSITCTEKTLEEKINYCHSHRNPYREWIGAQIRVDHYGYYNAGDPLAAAKAAFHDANLSHVKNGVYGAMFIAALISAAFTEKNVKNCIEIALSVIPKQSRLYEDILFAVDAAENSKDENELYQKLWDRFRDFNFVHTNNNAAACVAALIMGNGDFVKSVGLAIGAGWDTDCNGATVGSIMGALLSVDGIPQYLSEPLHDTLYSSIIGFHPASIRECAERTYKLYLNKN